MQIDDVPSVLRERLGDPATAGLLAVLDHSRTVWTSHVIDIVGNRFERRLVEETSKLRVEMTQGFAGIRQDLADVRASLRQELADGIGAVRQETAALRQEMMTGFAAIRQEMADQRFEILKWAFLFWVGQFFAVAGLATVIVRSLRP